MKPYDLHERLIDFAVMIINIAKDVENSKAGNHLTGQIIRSGSSPSLNYSEAQSAESRNDFIHKMSIVLKEITETLKENNELIAIFVKSIETSKLKLK